MFGRRSGDQPVVALSLDLGEVDMVQADGPIINARKLSTSVARLLVYCPLAFVIILVSHPFRTS